MISRRNTFAVEWISLNSASRWLEFGSKGGEFWTSLINSAGSATIIISLARLVHPSIFKRRKNTSEIAIKLGRGEI
jgi:hypothetical protein